MAQPRSDLMQMSSVRHEASGYARRYEKTWKVSKSDTPSEMAEVVELVLANLSTFLHPSFHVEISRSGGELFFGDGLYGTYSPNQEGTDSALDGYHHELLMHSDANMNLAGLASVIYWGYGTVGDSYARHRVRWFLNGQGSTPPVTSEIASHCLRCVRASIDCGQFGIALGCLGPMGQLSWTPFASKVMAFLAPHGAGVYDYRILYGLPKSRILKHIFRDALRGVGPVSSPTVQRRYDAWCAVLQTLVRSASAERPELQLRPLDIARAIFAAVA